MPCFSSKAKFFVLPFTARGVAHIGITLLMDMHSILMIRAPPSSNIACCLPVSAEERGNIARGESMHGT